MRSSVADRVDRRSSGGLARFVLCHLAAGMRIHGLTGGWMRAAGCILARALPEIPVFCEVSPGPASSGKLPGEPARANGFGAGIARRAHETYAHMAAAGHGDGARTMHGTANRA